MSDDGRLIPVEIHGQRYPIRSALEPEYVARIAAYVDERMRLAAETTPGSDSLRLAVLAALNLADELFRLREAGNVRDGQLAERAGQLEEMLDRILMASS
jgi:cell division protein ZapA